MSTLITQHLSSILRVPPPRQLSSSPNRLGVGMGPRILNTPISVSKPRLIAASSSSSSSSSSSGADSLKSRLRNGETLYGIFLCSFSPTLAEICGHAGYDFVVVDMEHGYGGIPDALSCLRALSSANTPAILRLPETTPVWTKKALDLGPQGLMFPMIQSPKDAKKAVSYSRYPPNGIRGAAHPIVRASHYGLDAGSYLGFCEDDLLIMCQVESEDAAHRVEDIAAVEGVDCIQMGPLDLSASMGYLWDPGNKKVMHTLHKVEKAVLKTKQNKSVGGAYLSGFAMPHDSPQDLKSRGYHMISGAVDIAMFRTAAVEDVKKFKLSLEMGSVDERAAEAKDGDDKYWSE